jgi:hypothetical protein
MNYLNYLKKLIKTTVFTCSCLLLGLWLFAGGVEAQVCVGAELGIAGDCCACNTACWGEGFCAYPDPGCGYLCAPTNTPMPAGSPVPITPPGGPTNTPAALPTAGPTTTPVCDPNEPCPLTCAATEASCVNDGDCVSGYECIGGLCNLCSDPGQRCCPGDYCAPMGWCGAAPECPLWKSCKKYACLDWNTSTCSWDMFEVDTQIRCGNACTGILCNTVTCGTVVSDCFQVCAPSPTPTNTPTNTPTATNTPTVTSTPMPDTISLVGRVYDVSGIAAPLCSDMGSVGADSTLTLVCAAAGYSESMSTDPANPIFVFPPVQPLDENSLSCDFDLSYGDLIPYLYCTGAGSNIAVPGSTSYTFTADPGDFIEWNFGLTSADPWFQTKIGDVWADGASITSIVPSSCTGVDCYFSLDQYPGSSGVNASNGVVAAANNHGFDVGDDDDKIGEVSDWLASGALVPSIAWTEPDYDFWQEKLADYITPFTGSTFNLSTELTPGLNVYHWPSAPGELTIQGDVAAGIQAVILAEGDIVINSGIKVDSGSFLLVVAQADITIGYCPASYDWTDGFYIASQNAIVDAGSCDGQLEVKGLFAGLDGVVLQRAFNTPALNNSTAVLKFSSNPDMFYNAPDEVKTSVTSWQEVNSVISL